MLVRPAVSKVLQKTGRIALKSIDICVRMWGEAQWLIQKRLIEIRGISQHLCISIQTEEIFRPDHYYYQGRLVYGIVEMQHPQSPLHLIDDIRNK